MCSRKHHHIHHHYFPHSTNANWDPLFFSSGTIFLHVTRTNFLLIPDSGRFSSAGHDGKRRAPSSSPRPSPRTAVRCLLLAGCDSDSAPICPFRWGRRRRWVSAPLIRLLRHPSPLPSPLPLAGSLHKHMLYFICVLQAAWGPDASGALRDSLRGLVPW